MGLFRKFIDRKGSRTNGSVTIGDVIEEKVDSVVLEGSDTPTQVVRHVLTKVDKVGQVIDMPTAEEYSLPNLMKSGVLLEPVNVSGMLDSSDMIDQEIIVNPALASIKAHLVSRQVENIEKPAEKVVESKE